LAVDRYRNGVQHPVRLLLSGDPHGDVGYLGHVCVEAVEQQANRIFLLGDVAWGWPDGIGDALKDGMEALVQTFGVPFWFLDGNHDNHALLPEDATEPVDLGDGITYVPRGVAFEADGTRFLVMGGAYSIDQQGRKRYVDYWPEEMPTASQWQRAIDSGRADVLLSHEAPGDHVLGGRHDADIARYPEAARMRANLLALIDVAQTPVAFHGHHHVRRTETIGGCTIHGLAANVTADLGSTFLYVTA
jgi:UDP-2,3-diacylglucosamine pyrophosphatase LpxH